MQSKRHKILLLSTPNLYFFISIGVIHPNNTYFHFSNYRDIVKYNWTELREKKNSIWIVLYNVIYMSWWYTNHPHICYINFHQFSVGSQTVCVWKTSPRSMSVCLKWEQEPLGGLRTVNTAPVGLCSTVFCNPRRAYFTHLICNHVKQGLVGVRLNDPSRYATTSANPTAEKRNVGKPESVRQSSALPFNQ